MPADWTKPEPIRLPSTYCCHDMVSCVKKEVEKREERETDEREEADAGK
jgi:hypothetical protein